MKRDWEVIRSILLGLEGLGDENARLASDQIAGIDNQTGAYHIALLIDAGLINGTCTNPSDRDTERFCYANSLTWQGHELLDSIRPQAVWQRIRAIAREKGLSLTFDVVKLVAGQVIGAMLK